MAYQQVRDILARVRAFHERVERYCEQSRDASHDDMVRAMLERIDAHDRAMDGCLTTYTSEATAAVLNTWIQYPGLEPLDEVEQAMSDAGDASPADVLQRLLDAERKLLDVYDTVADQAPGRHVQEFFQNLRFMEAQEGRAIGRDAASVRDVRSI